MHTTTTVSPAPGARPRLQVLVGGRSAADREAPVRLGHSALVGRPVQVRRPAGRSVPVGRVGRVGRRGRLQPAARPRLRLTRRGRLVLRWGGLLVAVLTAFVLVLVFGGSASAA